VKPYYADPDGSLALHLGDALTVLRRMPDASVDAVICDPPYALRDLPVELIVEALGEWLSGNREFVPAGKGFMSREWDRFVPPPAAWDECLRVLKPGGRLLAFAAPRTADLMGISIRLAGAEIRDSIMWAFGSGFPKGKQQLKPAHEPIVLACKPLSGTVAANVLEHGTGALNIDGCRVAWDPKSLAADTARRQQPRCDITGGRLLGGESGGFQGEASSPAGRWPTNVLLSHPPLLDADGYPVGDACAQGCVDGCPVAEMDAQSGVRTSGKMRAGVERANRDGWSGSMPATTGAETYGDTGGASRFFPVFRYEAKAPAHERPRLADGTVWPTVKPLALMSWLAKLVCPPGGLILDPFAGTGTTLEAAALESFRAIGVERDQAAADLAVARLSKPIQVGLFGGVS
jgi:site-specific DNA-methyltransferase (adenine-specific)